MTYLTKTTSRVAIASLLFGLASCNNAGNSGGSAGQTKTITIENVLDARPLVESGAFGGTPPGQSTSITFFAGKGQTLSFATMYGWSNDLFRSANPGISVYDNTGAPVEGDVSDQIKLWDNGTRVNQAPGEHVKHPGTAENKEITEVTGTDPQGNKYPPASTMVKTTLKYNGNSSFTLTFQNVSASTANKTPMSPGVWAVSYISDGNLLSPEPLYSKGHPTANGLTNIAEGGDNSVLKGYLQSITGIFTPLSPTLVVIYNGIDNPIFKEGEADRGQGLAKIAQVGDPAMLAAALKNVKGIKAVYSLAGNPRPGLLPVLNGVAGGKMSQQINVEKGDRLALATMYGFSNDWFFATGGDGVDATQSGDISSGIQLYNDGTVIDQFPGAGVLQPNLPRTPLAENKPISLVPNPNAFTSLPPTPQIIKVTLQ